MSKPAPLAWRTHANAPPSTAPIGTVEWTRSSELRRERGPFHAEVPSAGRTPGTRHLPPAGGTRVYRDP